MRTSTLFLLSSLMLPLGAFAQLDPYTLTVTASQPISAQPDLASLYVAVTTDPRLGLNDVLTLVQGVGLTQANFGSVNTYFNYVSSTQTVTTLQWTFSQTVPFAGLKDALTKLGALQATLAKQASGPMLTFSTSGVQTSQQALAALTCPLTTLVANARAQAQTLAQAAGFGLGGILTITDGSGAAVIGLGIAGSSAPAFRIGVDGTATVLLANLSSSVGTVGVPPPTCTIVVKFKLTLS